jgi:epoxyqueuosine reductase
MLPPRIICHTTDDCGAAGPGTAAAFTQFNLRYLREKVRQRLRACGGESRIVSVSVLRDLESEIESRHERGDFDEGFYGVELSFFQFRPPDSLPGARSVIVLAVPQPLVSATFARTGKLRRFVIPPTYDVSVNSSVEDMLARTLEPDGYRIAPSALPLKLLAVRSGLAAYGKNNICYVPRMGSYIRLMSFYSDLPASDDGWAEPAMLDRCRKCSACVNACFTHAIDPDRFLLHAERCLTFRNEHTGRFPDWVEPSWHHCLVGCMQCQAICPENARAAEWIESGPTFSEEETELLLGGVSREELSEELARKLETLGLLEYLELLPRNLRVLMDQDRHLDGRLLGTPFI